MCINQKVVLWVILPRLTEEVGGGGVIYSPLCQKRWGGVILKCECQLSGFCDFRRWGDKEGKK